MNQNSVIVDNVIRSVCASTLKVEVTDQKVDFLLSFQNHQSLSFYCDIFTVIQRIYINNCFLEILDVGSRTGAGANFLGQMFSQESYSRIKADVTALDISPEFLDYSNSFNKYLLNYLVGDVANLEQQFDIVICSHTLEHVSNPREFINTLIKKSRRYVIIACPFMEGKANIHKDANGLIEGHINSIDFDFIMGYQPIYFNVYRSLVWHQSLACIFVIDINTIQ